MGDFKLKHTTLYAKGWYKSRRYIGDEFINVYYDRNVIIDNIHDDDKYSNESLKEFKNDIRGIWWDLNRTLSADFEGNVIFTKRVYGIYAPLHVPDKAHIIRVLIRECNEIFRTHYKNQNPIDLENVWYAVDIDNVYAYGYYCKGGQFSPKHTNKYDRDEALASYLLSKLLSLGVGKLGIKLPSPDKKVLPIGKGIKEKRIKEMFGDG
jgi:hypothetical protein